ncbi:MAG: sulfatase-like hydrolase/transferase, partial [Acidimicrobiia bacterium]|nr:sulfatase-like hydrolase/transferase [Acidimicrobiia bacterium]
MTERPDVVLIVTDEERAAPAYESPELTRWRREHLPGRRWFTEHGVSFERHYTGATACVPSRPTLFTGQYPDVHGVTQTDGLGKTADDSRMRWLRPDEVPTLGHWFRAAGYDTHFDGKWHCSHADLIDPATGQPLATNTAGGQVIADAVEAYAEADPLDPFGFSGWIGPEPHGAPRANTGLVRDPLIADRVVRWLQDRYTRRLAGDDEARRPFLLVCCFVNPHDIVMWPGWARRSPLTPSPADPPAVEPSPTDDEDLVDKPALQAAYRAAYPSGYGPAALIARAYRRPVYRETYHRLHAEVDEPLDRVRRAVTAGSAHAVLALTSDHGDLLGSHGGLHQKWACAYDEATRVPLVMADTRHGARERQVANMATVHVDIVPTLLGSAGFDPADLRPELDGRLSEIHPLPGRDLSPLVADPGGTDPDRRVYFITRDNMLEGDSEAPGLARIRGRPTVPRPLRIQWLAHVGTSVEAVVTRIDGNFWKLVRTFDDPAQWTEPHVRHLAQNGPAGPRYRTAPLPDEWELYDLDDDPSEAHNRWRDGDLDDVRGLAREALVAAREESTFERNHPWPTATRIAAEDTMPP